MYCHQGVSKSYRHTAHHEFAQFASKDSILGSFAPGRNKLQVAAPAGLGNSLRFIDEASGDGFYLRSEGVGLIYIEVQSGSVDVQQLTCKVRREADLIVRQYEADIEDRGEAMLH